MTNSAENPDTTPTAPDPPERGADDRRSEVDPAQNPAPRSPEPDERAVEQGAETLERVKPY